MNFSSHRWPAAFLPGFFVGHISRAMETFSKVLPVLIFVAMFTTSFLPDSVQGQGRDLVGGNLVQFDDNGIWTWYSDERTVVDTNGNKLVVGCVENAAGLGGIDRDGAINVTRWDVSNGAGPRYILHPHLISDGGGDDHNAPGLVAFPNGKYLAMYTGHNADMITLYRTFDPVTGVWSAEGTNDWSTQPGGDNFNTTAPTPITCLPKDALMIFPVANGHGSQNRHPLDGFCIKLDIMVER